MLSHTAESNVKGSRRAGWEEYSGVGIVRQEGGEPCVVGGKKGGTEGRGAGVAGVGGSGKQCRCGWWRLVSISGRGYS